MQKRILQIPFHILLFPFFFVFHGFTGHFYYVSIPGALLLIVIYFTVAAILTAVFYALYKKIQPAAIMTFFVMSFNFFFGAVYDLLVKYFSSTFFIKYSVLISFFVLAGIALFFILRKRKTLSLLTSYLNILLLLLILFDTGSLTIQILDKRQINKPLTPGTPICHSCPKPDVFIIVLDEYAGTEGLKEIFGFENQSFLDSLTGKGFHVIEKSRSNYNATAYSIASMFNMEYIGDQTMDIEKTEFRRTREMINTNQLVAFFSSSGYHFYNYSVFEMANQPSPRETSYVPSNTKLITKSTFIDRFKENVLLNIATRLNWKGYLKRSMFVNRNYNEEIYNLTMKAAETNTKAPKVVYTHLLFPHYPHYYDKDGNPRPYDSLKSKNNKATYLSYLQYSNQKILKLVDYIQSHSPNKPIIALLSDHGFRGYNYLNEKKYLFSNLLTVYLPEKNYDLFNDTMTNVNFFRALLNAQFGQKFPVLQDTTIFSKF